MSDVTISNSNETKDDGDPRMPTFELYIKASTIDYESKGPCPICQQWFMIAYILAEVKCVCFQVYTVLASMPPKTFTEKLSGKNPSQYPVVIGVKGDDPSGQILQGLTEENIDDVEKFFERVNDVLPNLKRNTTANLLALKLFEDLYKKFNVFLKTDSDAGRASFTTYLKRIDDHLQTLETKFLCGNTLSYADCCLLPKLHHVRIACPVLKKYNIEEEEFNFRGIWTYLKNGYGTAAFDQTVPFDRDIISHCAQKANIKLVGSKSPNLMKREPPTMSVPGWVTKVEPESVTQEEEKTNHVDEEPQPCEENNHRENGDREEEDQLPEPDEINTNTDVYQEQENLENDEGQQEENEQQQQLEESEQQHEESEQQHKESEQQHEESEQQLEESKPQLEENGQNGVQLE